MSDDELSQKIEILGVSEEHRAMIPHLVARGLMNYWGAVFEHLSPTRVVASLLVDERHLQPWGILHGGVSVTLAETVASIGTWFHCIPPNEHAVGLEINANHLRPVSSGTIVVSGVPIHTGGTIHVWGIQVVHKEETYLVCTARCTVMKRRSTLAPNPFI